MKQYSVLVTILIISDLHLSMGFGIPMFEVKASSHQNVPPMSNPANPPNPDISAPNGHNTHQVTVIPRQGGTSKRTQWVPTIGGSGIKIQRVPDSSPNAHWSPPTGQQQPISNPSSQGNQWSPLANQQNQPMQGPPSQNTQWSPPVNQHQAVVNSPEIRHNNHWSSQTNQQQGTINPSHGASMSGHSNWSPPTGHQTVRQPNTANAHLSPPDKQGGGGNNARITSGVPYDNSLTHVESHTNFNQRSQNALEKTVQTSHWGPSGNMPKTGSRKNPTDRQQGQLQNIGNPSFSGPDHNSQWIPPTSAPTGGQKLPPGNNPNDRFSASNPQWEPPRLHSQDVVAPVVEQSPRLQEFYAEQPVRYENNGPSGQNPQWDRQTVQPRGHTGVPVDPQSGHHQTPQYENPDWNKHVTNRHQTASHTHHTNAPHYSHNQGEQGIPVGHGYPNQQAPNQWNQQSFERRQPSVNWEPPVQNAHQPVDRHRPPYDQNGNTMQWAQPDVISEFPPPPSGRPSEGHSSQFLPEVSLEMFSKMLQETKTGEPFSSITFSTTGPHRGNDRHTSRMVSQPDRYSYRDALSQRRPPSNSFATSNRNDKKNLYNHLIGLSSYGVVVPSLRLPSGDIPIESSDVAASNIGHGGRLNFFLGNDPTTRPTTTEPPVVDVVLTMSNGKPSQTIHPADGIPIEMPKVQHSPESVSNMADVPITTPPVEKQYINNVVELQTSKATTRKPVADVNIAVGAQVEKTQTTVKSNSVVAKEEISKPVAVAENQPRVKPPESKPSVKSTQNQDTKAVTQNNPEKQNKSVNQQESTAVPYTKAVENSKKKPNESASVTEKQQILDKKVIQTSQKKPNDLASVPVESKQTIDKKAPNATQKKHIEVLPEKTNSSIGNDASKQNKGTQSTNKPPENKRTDGRKVPNKLSNYASIINTWLVDKEKPQKAENPIANTKLAATTENSALRIRLAKLLADLLSTYDKASPKNDQNQISKIQARADNSSTSKVDNAQYLAHEKVSKQETLPDNKPSKGNSINLETSKDQTSKATVPASNNGLDISKASTDITNSKNHNTEVKHTQTDVNAQETAKNMKQDSKAYTVKPTKEITVNTEKTQTQGGLQNEKTTNTLENTKSANPESSYNQTKVTQNESQKPEPEIKRHSIESNQTNIKYDQSPVADNHLPVKSHQPLVTNNQAPVENNRIPVKKNQVRVENKQTPMENKQKTVENNLKPASNEWRQLLKGAKSARPPIQGKAEETSSTQKVSQAGYKNQNERPTTTPSSRTDLQQSATESGPTGKIDANEKSSVKTSRIPKITSDIDQLVFLGNVKSKPQTKERKTNPGNQYDQSMNNVLDENQANQEPMFGTFIHDPHLPKRDIETIGDKPYNSNPSYLPQNEAGGMYNNMFETSTHKAPQTSGIPVYLDPGKIRFTEKTVSPTNDNLLNNPINSHDLHGNEFIDNKMASSYTPQPGKITDQETHKTTTRQIPDMTTPISADSGTKPHQNKAVKYDTGIKTVNEMAKLSSQATQANPTQVVQWDVTTPINGYDPGKHTTHHFNPSTDVHLSTAEPQYLGSNVYELQQATSMPKHIHYVPTTDSTAPSYAGSNTYKQKHALAMSKDQSLKNIQENEEMSFGNFLSYDTKDTANKIPEQPKKIQKYLETKSTTTTPQSVEHSTTASMNLGHNGKTGQYITVSQPSLMELRVTNPKNSNSNFDRQYHYPMEGTHDFMAPELTTTQSSMQGAFDVNQMTNKYEPKSGISTFNGKSKEAVVVNSELNTIGVNGNGSPLEASHDIKNMDANILPLNHEPDHSKLLTNINELQSGNPQGIHNQGIFDIQTGQFVDRGTNINKLHIDNTADGNMFFGNSVHDNFGHAEMRFGHADSRVRKFGQSNPKPDNFGNAVTTTVPIVITEKPYISSGNVDKPMSNFRQVDNAPNHHGTLHEQIDITAVRGVANKRIDNHNSMTRNHHVTMSVTDFNPPPNHQRNFQHGEPVPNGFAPTTTKPITSASESRFNARSFSAFPELRISRRPTLSKVQPPSLSTTESTVVITQPSIPTPADSNYFGTADHMVPDTFAFGSVGNEVPGHNVADPGSSQGMLSLPFQTTVQPFHKGTTVYNNRYFSGAMTTQRSITDPLHGNHPALAMNRVDPTIVDIGNSFRGSTHGEHMPPSRNTHEHVAGSNVIARDSNGPYSFPNPVEEIPPIVKPAPNVEPNYYKDLPVMAIVKTSSNVALPPSNTPIKETRGILHLNHMSQPLHQNSAFNEINEKSIQDISSVAAYRTPVSAEPRIVIDNVPHNIVTNSGKRIHFDSFSPERRPGPVRPLTSEHAFHGPLQKSNMFPELSIGGSQQNYINKQTMHSMHSEPAKQLNEIPPNHGNTFSHVSHIPVPGVDTSALPMNKVPQMLTNTVHKYMDMLPRENMPTAPVVTPPKSHITTPGSSLYLMPITTHAPVEIIPTRPTITKRPITMAPTTTTSTPAPTTTPRPTTTPKPNPTTVAPTPKPVVTTMKPTTPPRPITTTPKPTTAIPTTLKPTTAVPTTTPKPTTAIPTTTPKPTTAIPTTIRRYFTTSRPQTTPIVAAPIPTAALRPMPVITNLPPTTVKSFTTPVTTTPAILTTLEPLSPKEKRQISKVFNYLNKNAKKKNKAFYQKWISMTHDEKIALVKKQLRSRNSKKSTAVNKSKTRQRTTRRG